jgi:phosphopantothenoylcysteine decarboxylase/phosphopantothenate--cysteine ligase
MWTHPATQRNLAQLTADGVRFVGPDAGAMACGEFGPGRMAEPEAICAAILSELRAKRRLAGKRALVTAGPTIEPIDPVRFLSNRSSGKQGYAIADALARLGAEVTLVSGPTALAAPAGVRRINVDSADQMWAACEAALPVDIFFAVAAVADWAPAAPAGQKLKKTKTGAPQLALRETRDILKTIAAHAQRPALVVGFAAETHDLLAHAQAKLAAKGADWIIANDVSGDVMGGDANEIAIVRASGVERWGRMTKAEVAARLAQAAAQAVG